MDFIYFLGRFHVLALHLPIALVLVTILAEWLARREKYRYLEPALGFLWAASAITAIATVALGYMHFAEGGFSGPSAMRHRLLGTSVAVVATAAWLLRTFSLDLYRRGQAAFGIALLVLVTLTGHYGGNMTHGDTYLVEYAPEPIRRLAGLQAAREPVTDVALADPFLDIVQPIFAQRCASCHNNDRQRGGLNLTAFNTVMAGGEIGPVIVPGDLTASDLYRRITLPQDHEDFMPTDGKTPLTESQVAVLRWWIESGAPTGTTISALDVTDEVRPLLAAQLGLANAVEGAASGAAPAAGEAATSAAATADPALVERLAAAGFMARQVSQTDPALIVSPVAAGTPMGPEQVSTLAGAPDQIVELSLQRTGVDDSAIASIAQLPALTHLRLENNKITDAGVAVLKPLTKLEYLNLYGNAGVTDRSVEALASLTALKEVYLWQTGVTARGVARLQQLRPDLVINNGETSAPTRTAGAPAPAERRGS